jgi:hypothetical protein
MGSSAFDLVLVPVLWGTVGGIGAGTVLLYAMQGTRPSLKNAAVRHDQWSQRLRAAASPCPCLPKRCPSQRDQGTWMNVARAIRPQHLARCLHSRRSVELRCLPEGGDSRYLPGTFQCKRSHKCRWWWRQFSIRLFTCFSEEGYSGPSWSTLLRKCWANSHGSRTKVVLANLVEELASADTQLFGGLGPVAAASDQGALDRAPLDLGEQRPKGHRARRVGGERD